MLSDLILLSAETIVRPSIRYLYELYQRCLERESLRRRISYIWNTFISFTPSISERNTSSTDMKHTQQLHQILFFTYENMHCKSHMNTMKSCGKKNCPVGHLRMIKDLLDGATRTLDICLYCFTFNVLIDAVKAAINRGVIVKIILEGSEINCKITEICTEVVKVCDVPTSQYMGSYSSFMHHKFAIIDSCILITGSLNWTANAIFGNFENVTLTNNPSVIEQYEDQFKYIWQLLGKSYDEESMMLIKE